VGVGSTLLGGEFSVGAAVGAVVEGAATSACSAGAGTRTVVSTTAVGLVSVFTADVVGGGSARCVT
jgi:hypothetical protein